MTFRKREDAINWKRKHQLVLSGEFAVVESMDLSHGRLRNVQDFVAPNSFVCKNKH
jgi:hypothetical protein